MKKIGRFLLSSFIFSALIFPISAQAAEKEQSVEIKKNYGEAVFHFDFATTQEYEITITDAYGNAKVSTVNTDTAAVSILNPTVGEYSILITADEDISVESKVELKNQLNITPDDKISVSAVLSGLRLYFADGCICGSWNDTQIGNVNVSITNTKNMQILYSNTVKGTTFSYELADEVEEIQVYLVPSNNAKTEGAGVSYTLEVVRELPGEVQFPSQNLTNQDSISASVSLQEELAVLVVENGSLIYQEALESGKHTLHIPLAGIDNRIEVVLMDARGNFITHPYNVEKDVVAPTIKLRGEYDNSTTYGNTIEIKGTLTDAVTLLCNDIEVHFEQPTFTIKQELDRIGVNEIVLKALDEAGNEAVITLHITRAERNYTGLIITLVVLALAGMGFAFFCRRRKANNKPDPAQSEEKADGATTHNDNSLEYESTHDAMTGLFNRTAYKKRLLTITKEKMCIIYFDVNNLKKTNDLLGHQSGDKLLTTVAVVIEKAFPHSTYRIGGDEFVVLLENVKVRGIDKKLKEIDKELDEKSQNSTEEITYQVAYGYAFGNKKDSVDAIIKKADEMMYSCKEKKKKEGLSYKILRQMSDARTRQEKERADKMLKKMWYKEIIGGYILLLVTTCVMAIFFFGCVINTTIASGSMEPTLMTGDHIVYNRLAYTIAEVQRGDIISFNSREYEKNMSKRVIGIAGDHIEFHDGYVFINGALCVESYLEEGVETNCSKEFDVPEGCVFVMGDNRENSTDSRFFKNPYIPVEDIIGKYLGQLPF